VLAGFVVVTAGAAAVDAVPFALTGDVGKVGAPGVVGVFNFLGVNGCARPLSLELRMSITSAGGGGGNVALVGEEAALPVE